MSRACRILSAIICVAISVCSFGCKDEGTSPPTAPANFVGTVQDEQGNPVSDVGVHYMFIMDAVSRVQTMDSPLPGITLQYALSQPGHVNIRILRWYTRELIMSVVDTEQNPGIHAVTFDANRLTNGVYIYRISIGDSVAEGRLLMVHLDQAELVASQPLATSNAEGRFSIPNAVFGFGLPFVRRTPSGEVMDTTFISPAIHMVLHKEGYQTLAQPISIDPSRDLTMNFVLRR